MKNMYCDNMVCNENMAWMVGNHYNAIFSLDFKTNQFEFISKFPNENINIFREHQLCRQVDKNLLFFPDNGQILWIYNINKKTFKHIEIPNPQNVRIGINLSFYLNNRIYAVSSGLQQIIEIDLEENKICNICEFGESSSRSGVSSEGCVVDKCFYFTLPEQNEIVEYSTETKEIKKFVIDKKFFPQTICWDDHSFWLTGRTREIVRWNRNLNSSQDYDIPMSVGAYEAKEGELIECVDAVEYEKPLFRWSVRVNDMIWLIPNVATKVMVINLENQTIDALDIESEHEDIRSWMRTEKVKHRFECVYKNRFIWLYSFKNREYLVLDTKTGEIQRPNIFLDNKDKLLAELQREHAVIKEEAWGFLEFLEMGYNKTTIIDNEIGKRIYQQVVDCVGAK